MQERVGDAPLAFVASNGGAFLIQAHDLTDMLQQIAPLESDGVAHTEVFACEHRPRRRLGCRLQALNHESGILDPHEAIVVLVNEHLVGLELRDAPAVRSPVAQALELDRLAGMQPLTDREDALRILEHMGDRGAKLQQLEIGGIFQCAHDRAQIEVLGHRRRCGLG